MVRKHRDEGEGTMVQSGTVETPRTTTIHRPANRRNPFRIIHFAIAGAAAIGWSAGYANAATTYSFTSFTAGTYDWTTGANWTATDGIPNANNSPGTDPAIPGDIANIAFNSAASTGPVIINLGSPLSATLGSLTLSLQSGSSSDTLNLNLNANLSITGDLNEIGGGATNKNGKTILNTATGTTLTVRGTLSVSGADGGGSASVTINGNLTAAATQLKDEGDNIIVTATAGTVNLGNFTLLRSASSGFTIASAGLHLNGGTVSASDFFLGTGSSSGVAVVAGANLTISGSFIIGDPQSGTANTTRPNTLLQTSGTVTATASSGLSLAAATPAANATLGIASAGTYNLSGGTLNLPLLQMTGSGPSSPSTNKALFALSGNATVNIGSGGIVLGTGSATFTSTGGTIAATGSWANTYAGNLTLSSGITQFQAGDGSGTPFNMAIDGHITGAGTLWKTGNGTLTLGGSSTYTGSTTVNAGTLYVNNSTNSGTGTGFVLVANGTLGGHGIITGSGGVDIATGSHLAPGVNNVGTLTIGALTLESGSTTDFDFNTAANSMVTITNFFGINGGGINLYQEGTTTPFSSSGTYTLFNFTGTATIPSNYAALQILNGVAGVTYTLSATATAITITLSGGPSGWATDADGSWATASNWGSSTLPVAGTVATFGPAITAPHTVTLDANRTVAGILFNNTHTYILASGTAGSTLTLDNGAANATINDLNGSHSITAPLLLNSPTAITITNPGDTLTLAGNISGTGFITQSGAGTLILSGTISYTGGTTLNSGTLGGTGVITGSVFAGSSPHTINPGLPNSTGTLTLGGLTTNPNTTLAFDLTSPTAANDRLAVTSLLNLGGGTIAMASPSTTGLGYYKILSYSTLTGSTSSILLPPTANNITYTLDTTRDLGFLDLHRGYLGDANDDGKVDLNDLNLVLNNLGTANTSWSKGNFDGGATIDLTDLNDVLNNLCTSIASGSTVVATAPAPEPASLSLLALGTVALTARRRKA
jgi:fibronectin-binding autotransporter adhesin